jgi:hypothetical protein
MATRITNQRTVRERAAARARVVVEMPPPDQRCVALDCPEPTRRLDANSRYCARHWPKVAG